MKGVTSEANYKKVYLIAGEALPESFVDETAVKLFQVTDEFNYTTTGVEMSVLLTLDEAKTAALAGKQALEVSIYDHSGAAAIWQISDIKFVSYTEGLSSIAVKYEYDATAFVPVRTITGIPVSAKVGEEVTLTPSVWPTNATNKTVVWSVLAPGAGITAVTAGKITATEEGTIQLNASITNGLTASTPYNQNFYISFDNLPEFTNATYVETDLDAKAIGFAGLDGDNDLAVFKAAKFLVLGFKGSNTGSTDGFGGMQIGISHGPSQWSMNPADRFDAGDWTSLSNTGEVTYWVVPLALVPHHDTAILADNAKIVLNHGIIGDYYVGAWLTAATLTIGDGVAVDGTVGGVAATPTGSWVTKNTGLTPK